MKGGTKFHGSGQHENTNRIGREAMIEDLRMSCLIQGK